MDITGDTDLPNESDKRASLDFVERVDNRMDSDCLNSESVLDMDTDNQQCELETSILKDNLLDCVARSNGFFKSQQIGEKDLTFSEKRKIASDLLIESVSLFLQRYWQFIEIDCVPYFDSHRSNYEVNFYISEIEKSHNIKTNKVRVKNRRYEALKQMVDDGSYFSDAEMKSRNPFMYEQMIGQHLTEAERIAAYKKQHPDEKFSAFLMDQIEKNSENSLYKKQKDEDEAIVEEEDDDTSEEESELEDEPPVKKVISEEEKKKLRSEFTNIMYESFLDGKDRDFDYSSVDNNAEFDSVHQRDIDEQEKYFDESSDDGY